MGSIFGVLSGILIDGSSLHTPGRGLALGKQLEVMNAVVFRSCSRFK